MEDYHLIQKFLRNKVKDIVKRPLSSRPFHNDELNKIFHGWITYRMSRSGGLVRYDETGDVVPTRNIIYFNNNSNNK